MYLLIQSTVLAFDLLLLGVMFVGLSTVTWAGLFERKAWAWPLELLRLAVGAAVLYASRA
jgi:hypothetical protein